MADNIVDLGLPVNARKPQELFKHYAKKDINADIKHAIIITQDEDNCIDIAYTEMDAGDLCFLTMFLQSFVSRGLTETEEE